MTNEWELASKLYLNQCMFWPIDHVNMNVNLKGRISSALEGASATK